MNESKTLIADLNSINLKLKQDINGLTNFKETNEMLVAKLKSDLSQANAEIEKTKTNHEIELKTKIDTVTNQLNSKWNDVLM